jgi:hypothetical protein
MKLRQQSTTKNFHIFGILSHNTKVRCRVTCGYSLPPSRRLDVHGKHCCVKIIVWIQVGFCLEMARVPKKSSASVGTFQLIGSKQ